MTRASARVLIWRIPVAALALSVAQAQSLRAIQWSFVAAGQLCGFRAIFRSRSRAKGRAI